MNAAAGERRDRLVDEARSFVGAPAAAKRTSREPVNIAMINHWCDAIGDRNPAYSGEDPIAPPAMLGTWTMDGTSGAAGVWTARGAGAQDDGRGPRDEVLRRLDEAGYTAVVATNYEQTYLRPLRPGDVVSESLTVEDLSERKETALGTGFFVTVRHDYRDAGGDVVGVARMRLLKFQPPDRVQAHADPPPAATRARPPVNADNAFFWDGVAQGELRLQRCASCRRLQHPPRPMCGACRSVDFETVTATGRGEVYSYAIHHHPPLPGIELPLVAILVELEEGVRFVSSLTGAAPEDVSIGMPVEVVFDTVDGDLTLPLFRPRVHTGAAS